VKLLSAQAAESRFGLISDARRCLSMRRKDRLSPSRAYAAVSIGSGQSDSSKGGEGLLQIFLDEIADRYPNEKPVMVLDKADWHLGNNLKIPKNMRLL
jgi:hypothetical protein